MRVFRRQTAEEREAERQAASRLIMSLHNEAITKGLYAAAAGPSLDRDHVGHFSALQGLANWTTAASPAAVAALVQQPTASEHHSPVVSSAHYSISSQPPMASPIC